MRYSNLVGMSLALSIDRSQVRTHYRHCCFEDRSISLTPHGMCLSVCSRTGSTFHKSIRIEDILNLFTNISLAGFKKKNLLNLAMLL